MRSRVPLSGRVATAFLLALLVSFLGGCSKPSDEARQNRRIVDSLLTAATTGNQKEFEKCKGMLDERHATGLLAEANYKRLCEIFDQAGPGKSDGAIEALYEFRKSEPFPK